LLFGLLFITFYLNNIQICGLKRAFGIRVKYSGSSRPNPYNSETISLFIKSGIILKKVLINYETVSAMKILEMFNGNIKTYKN
jgi:hypothetical protein